MTKDQIVTAFHKASWVGLRDDVQKKYHAAAKYCIDSDVVGIIQRADAFQSVAALVEANVCRLPFTPMMMEFQATERFRWFILLEEINEGESLKAQAVFIHLPTEATYWSSRDIDVYMDKEGFTVNGVARTQDAHAIICGVTMALLFLNTKGIEKQVIEPTALNKARARKGRVPIPKVTVLRIGTVYDRNGNAVKGGGVPGMRKVHLRAGHTRRQHFGPANSETKIIYIPPVLVNYRPEEGDKMPALPEKRVRL